MKTELNIVIAAVVLWCIGFSITPFFSDSAVNEILYTFYSTVCHQFESRTIHFYEQPLAICARCTGIYGGFLVGILVVRFSTIVGQFKKSAISVIIVSIIPMAAHVFLELGSYIPSSLIVRIVTGVWFGIGMSLLLHRTLTELIHSLISILKKNYEFTTR